MILYRPSFERAFKRLTDQEKEDVRQAIRKLERSFGRPHFHSGLSIRAFGKYYECRAGLKLRCLFLPAGGDLILTTVGNHNDIRRYVADN